MKKYLAWIGQNATTGTPHPQTGRLSMYGDLVVFYSKQERDSFCNEYNYLHDCYPVPTNMKEAKSKYCAGMTQVAFEDTIRLLEELQAY